MKLPWKKLKEQKKELEEEIEQLEEQLEDLKEERDSYQERFEAEKQRRKKLSKQKQEVEERINRLEDKLEAQGEEGAEPGAEKEEDDKIKGSDFQELEFEGMKKLLQKLSTVGSEDKDLLTVYSPEKVADLADLKELKNSVSKEYFSRINDEAGFVAFLDPELGGHLLKLSSFYSGKVSLGKKFDVSDIQEFVESEKYWILASAGYTEIYREEDGKYEELETVKSRVNREHSKGGFSQGRFERKREEQIEGHVEDVKEVVEELDLDEGKVYVLGDGKLSEELPGTYLGGFDPNRQKPGQFYKIQLKRF